MIQVFEIPEVKLFVFILVTLFMSLFLQIIEIYFRLKNNEPIDAILLINKLVLQNVGNSKALRTEDLVN